MAWETLHSLPESRVYLDEYGNIHWKRMDNGRFISGKRFPAYGTLGYGDVIELSARVI